MAYETIKYEVSEQILTITLNRPEKLNAINKAVAIELQEAFVAFDRSDQRVAILTGRGGRAFSAGADVTDLPELWRCVPTVGIATDKPIIAAVSGWCIGGGLVMAMMCDLLVAAENAKFSYPEGKVGITGGMIAGLAARNAGAETAAQLAAAIEAGLRSGDPLGDGRGRARMGWLKLFADGTLASRTAVTSSRARAGSSDPDGSCRRTRAAPSSGRRWACSTSASVSPVRPEL